MEKLPELSEVILSKYSDEIFSLALESRRFILGNLPAIIEQPDISANMIGFSYGPGYKDMICTLIPSLKGIKIGFYKGTELNDPKKLLTGTGKVHKYVVINSKKDLNADLINLFEDALEKKAGRK